MTDTWVCVIGGGRSQVPFIEAAIERGLSTVVFDLDADAPARDAATEFVVLSTHDTAGVIAHLEGSPRDLVGCFTYSSHEGALITTTRVVDRFGVRGLSRRSLDRTSSKVEMRRHLTDAGLPVPAWEETADPADLEAFRGRHGRVMMKPARGSVGSEGVAVVNPGAIDCEAVLRLACDVSSDGLAIIESFVDGIEYSIDGFVIDGQVQTLTVSRKYSGGPEAPFVIAGFVIGGVAPQSTKRLESLAGAAVPALALDNSYFSLDVLEAGGDLLVIDAGPLLDAKIDRLLHHAGVDVYGIAADIACGGPVLAAKPRPVCHGLRFVYSDRVGTLQGASSGQFSASHDGGKTEMVLEMEKEVGDRVGPPQSIADVLGWVCASDTDAGRLWSALGSVDLAGLIEVGEPM